MSAWVLCTGQQCLLQKHSSRKHHTANRFAGFPTRDLPVQNSTGCEISQRKTDN